MKTSTVVIIVLSLAAAASAAPRLSLSGDVAISIPIGDLAADELDTGYRSVPVFRGGLVFVPLPPFLAEAGGAYALRTKAKTGIDRGEVSWQGTNLYAGLGIILDMGLLMPYLSAGASYFYISRDDAARDPVNRDVRVAEEVSVQEYGFYIDLGLQYFLYEHFALNGGLHYDHALTAGKPARIFDVHGGVEYYLF